MKLYPIPGGDWAGTEADWKSAMKARGLNPKDFEATKTREVPTGKKELMEFLTFFAVDVYRTGTAVPTAKPDIVVDHAALQARHNPDAPDLVLPAETIPTPPIGVDVDDLFNQWPLGTQLRLAVAAIDNANAALRR